MKALIILQSILEFILIIYFITALALFLNFIIRGYNVTVTDKKTKQKVKLSGFKKFITCLGMSLIWPVIIIKEFVGGE